MPDDQAQSKNTLQIFCCAADPYQDQENCIRNADKYLDLCVACVHVTHNLYYANQKSVVCGQIGRIVCGGRTYPGADLIRRSPGGNRGSGAGAG